jgi:hypothetical protein
VFGAIHRGRGNFQRKVEWTVFPEVAVELKNGGVLDRQSVIRARRRIGMSPDVKGWFLYFTEIRIASPSAAP